MRLQVLILTVIMGFSACRCAQTEDPRSAWLENTIYEDHRDILLREPALTELKFEKMALSPFNYFRGTAGQYLRDVSRPLKTRAAGFSGQTTLLVGDPHPENLGVYRDLEGEQYFEFNDFDAATLGPPEYDVWRLAVGFAVLEAQANTSCESVAAVVDGYASHWRSESVPLDGAIVDDLKRRGLRDGAAREELDDYTGVENGVRTHKVGDIEAREGALWVDTILEPTPEQAQLVQAAFSAYEPTVATRARPGAIKGIVRRLGAGVASYPFLRFYVLTEGPTESLDDDVLLEVKETLAAPRGAGLPIAADQLWSSNGERVVDAQRRLQSSPDVDPLLGWGDAHGMTFRVHERTKYQKGFDVERYTENFADGEWTCDDATLFARQSGAILAQAHGRGGLDLTLSLAQQDETTTFATSYAARVLEDYQRFRQLVERRAWAPKVD